MIGSIYATFINWFRLDKKLNKIFWTFFVQFFFLHISIQVHDLFEPEMIIRSTSSSQS